MAPATMNKRRMSESLACPLPNMLKKAASADQRVVAPIAKSAK